MDEKIEKLIKDLKDLTLSLISGLNFAVMALEDYSKFSEKDIKLIIKNLEELVSYAQMGVKDIPENIGEIL